MKIKVILKEAAKFLRTYDWANVIIIKDNEDMVKVIEKQKGTQTIRTTSLF